MPSKIYLLCGLNDIIRVFTAKIQIFSGDLRNAPHLLPNRIINKYEKDLLNIQNKESKGKTSIIVSFLSLFIHCSTD